MQFESSVNLQGSKTGVIRQAHHDLFESSVNLQGSKTDIMAEPILR